MKKLSLLLLLVCMSQIVFAQTTWKPFYIKNGTYFFYNSTKLIKTGNIRQIWVKERKLSNGKFANISLVLVEVNCEYPQYRIVAIKDYKRNDSWDAPNAKFSTIFPDTIIEEVQKTACK